MGSKNQTSTVTQQLPGYINDAYKKLIESAGQTASTGYTPYTGGFTPDQQQAFENIRSMWGTSDPAFNASMGAFNTSMVPTSENVSQYMSPYMNSVISSAMANMQEQNAQQQQQVIGNAAMKGALGGNRVGVAQAELARQQKLADNKAIADLYNQGYGTALGAAQADKTAALQAAQGYAGLGQTQMQTGLAQAASQLGAGTQQQQFDYQQYLNKLAFPYQQQSWLASIVGGLGSTAGGTTTEKKPTGNIFSQLLGAGLGVASLFSDGGAVRPRMAVGGIPYANDNADFPSPMSRSGLAPYANDNEMFGSYVPQVAVGGLGGHRIPARPAATQEADPLAGFGSVLKEGASNIKGWLTPDASSVRMPALYSGGGVVGRHGYADGGRPTPAEIEAFYSGILLPGPRGGIVGNPDMPPTAPRPLPDVPTIDTVNALDGDRLGLGVDTTLPPRGEDPYMGTGGGEDYEPLYQRPRIAVPGGNRPGEVIYGTGDQFVTRPQDGGYSRNIGEAWQSLMAGKGLNFAPDVRHGLLTAGLGMMASKSPFVLQGVGEGGLAGAQAWREYQAMERENALARAAIGQKGEELALTAQRLGAEIPNVEASTLATDTATQRERFDYRYTPFGVQIIDKVSGTPGAIFPYGSIMPTGEIAERPDDAPLFEQPVPSQGPLDARLMSPEGAGQAIAQGSSAIQAAQDEYRGATQTQQMLQEMKHNLAQLPAEGIMAPGTDFAERANLAKAANTYLSVFGMDPYFPTGEVAAAEDLNKLTKRLGFDLGRMLGSGEAASVIQTAIESVPGGANSKKGAERIIAGLEAANRRRIDYYERMQNWAAKNGGSVLGFDEWFNSVAPPELYALSSYVPVEAMEFLRANPNYAEAFNKKYGDGKDIARYVLGR